jgi:hypothetical protein
MLATTIYATQLIGEPLVLCTLAWDETEKRIAILKNKRIGKKILKEKYLNKRLYFETGHMPAEHEYLEASMGEYFIRNLCYGIAGSYIWASKPYKISNKKSDSIALSSTKKSSRNAEVVSPYKADSFMIFSSALRALRKEHPKWLKDLCQNIGGLMHPII